MVDYERPTLKNAGKPLAVGPDRAHASVRIAWMLRDGIRGLPEAPEGQPGTGLDAPGTTGADRKARGADPCSRLKAALKANALA